MDAEAKMLEETLRTSWNSDDKEPPFAIIAEFLLNMRRTASALEIIAKDMQERTSRDATILPR